MRRVQCGQRPKPNRALPAAGMAGWEDTLVAMMVLVDAVTALSNAPRMRATVIDPHLWCQSA